MEQRLELIRTFIQALYLVPFVTWTHSMCKYDMSLLRLSFYVRSFASKILVTLWPHWPYKQAHLLQDILSRRKNSGMSQYKCGQDEQEQSINTLIEEE